MTHDPPDNNELDKRIIRLEERMNTLKAENTSAQERLNATLEGFRTDQAQLRDDMAKRDAARAERDAARAERDADRAERDATARWWQTAILIAALAALITFAPDLQRLASGS